MDKTTLRVALVCLLWACQMPVGHTLNFGTEDAVRAATFEFLAPGSGPHAKGLVGTAFAIGPNEFVTAAHLLDTAIGSRFEHPVLLDSRQVAYPIADILQFSEQQDYVVFSLERPPRINPLPVQRSEPSEHDVYFAGWTPASRVVIKRGTFSGTTRDQESHRFDWLRFSGSVWGALGGGPLLDASGHVVGVVQGVSRGEGSNYAVPISQVTPGTPENAHIHGLEMLRALMPAVSSVEPLDAQIPLPMSFEQFSNEVKQLRLAYFERAIGPLLEGTRRNFVLTGDGAPELCNVLNGKTCECKARPNISGELVLDNPHADEMIRKLDAGEDIAQKVAGVVLVRTRTTNDSNAQRSDPSSNALLHLRLAVSADMERQAEPGEDVTYVDFHDRTWHLRTWTLLDRDSESVSLTRELPHGHVVLTRTVPTALSDAAEMQLKFVANLVYYGCDALPGEGVAQVADTMHR